MNEQSFVEGGSQRDSTSQIPFEGISETSNNGEKTKNRKKEEENLGREAEISTSKPRESTSGAFGRKGKKAERKKAGKQVSGNSRKIGEKKGKERKGTKGNPGILSRLKAKKLPRSSRGKGVSGQPYPDSAQRLGAAAKRKRGSHEGTTRKQQQQHQQQQQLLLEAMSGGNDLFDSQFLLTPEKRANSGFVALLALIELINLQLRMSADN